MTITPKLVYWKKTQKREKGIACLTRYCMYCQKEMTEDYVVIDSSNDGILEIFGMSKMQHGRIIFLCPECFDKLHPSLEQIESEGWTTLEESEFPDLDKELQESEEEDGSGTQGRREAILTEKNRKNLERRIRDQENEND